MKKYTRPFFILLGIIVSVVAVFFISCDNNAAPGIESNAPTQRSLSVRGNDLIGSIDHLSFDIFAKINASHTNDNLFVSPFFIWERHSGTILFAGKVVNPM